MEINPSENTIIIDRDKYINALREEKCEPAGIFAPFINVDRAKYRKFRSDARALDFTNLQKRYDPKLYSDVKTSALLSMRRSLKYFHPYQFFLSEFLNDEWLATVDWHKPFHRDHVLHQPMTTYLGMQFLKDDELNNMIFDDGSENSDLLNRIVDIILYPGPASYILQYLKEMGGPDIYFPIIDNGNIYIRPATRMLWKNIVLDVFFMASLFHDIGYPSQFTNTIINKIAQFLPSGNPVGKSADWFADRYEKRLVFYPLKGYISNDPSSPGESSDKFHYLIEEGMGKTHGMPGALLFLYMNDAIQKHPKGRSSVVRRFCIELAAMTIMMHDMGNIYGEPVKLPNSGGVKDDSRWSLKLINPELRLLFHQDPLSSLLTFCDLIEDFGRPTAEFLKPPDPLSNCCCREKRCVKYTSRCKQVTLKWNKQNNSLNIKYHYVNEGDLAQNKRTFIQKNIAQFFDPNKGYLDMTMSGIRRITLSADLAT